MFLKLISRGGLWGLRFAVECSESEVGDGEAYADYDPGTRVSVLPVCYYVALSGADAWGVGSARAGRWNLWVDFLGDRGLELH